MTEQANDQDAPTEGSRSTPDWVTSGPKPIELPPLGESDEPKTEEKQRPSRRGRLVLMLALAVALLGTSPYWAPSLGRILPWSPRPESDSLVAAMTQLDQRLSALAQREMALDQRVAQLDEQTRSAASAAAALREQATAFKNIEQRLAALEQRPTPSPGVDPQQFAALQDELRKLATAETQAGERLAKLETSTGSGAERGDQAMLLALGQLRTQLQGSQPFAAELGAIEALGRNRPEVRVALDPLRPASLKGIPSMAVLTQRFEREVVPAMLRNGAVPQSDNWSDRILAKLRSLVVVRRVGDNAKAAGDPLEAGVARAEAALSASDLAGAIKAVEALPDPAAAAEQTWLTEARQRLAAEEAVTKLTNDATARLAADDRAGARDAER